MTTMVAEPRRAEPSSRAWDGFQPGIWQKEINVATSSNRNYEPYDGDETFLAPATDRAQRLWNHLNELFLKERKKGVPDVSQIPSSTTAHAPG